MELSPKEIAEKAITSAADDETARLILELAKERARAQHAASMALDQRVTQVALLQFTAAALSAALASGSQTPVFAQGLSAIGAVLFVLGAAVCFRGIRSGPGYPPGLPPVWWGDTGSHAEPFVLRHAMCWAAGAIQQAIDANVQEDSIRSRHLNLGLNYAMAGGLMIMAAALFRIIA